jgi:Icc protein
VKVIQISDTHLSKNSNYRIYGLVNTTQTFLDVVNAIKEEKPDFVIATGDLSQDGSPESYQRLKEQLQTLDCDVFTIPGNHDIPEIMNNNLIDKNIKFTQYKQTTEGTFIFCNSRKENFDTGFISKEELVSLERSLTSFDDCIIVIHHHFVKLNAFIDKYILENHEEFNALLHKYKAKIKLCITGHVHNTYHLEKKGIAIHNSLSTCIQLAKTQSLLFDFKRPGYTVFNFIKNSYEVSEKTI